MGLTIKGNKVEVDPTHNQLLNTGVNGNPFVQIIGALPDEMYVYSTFQRHMTPRSLSRDPNIKRGDNCHLIYALKKKDKWHTTFGSVRHLRRNFTEIVAKMKADTDKHVTYDALIPMPSGHAISDLYAERIAEIYGCPVLNGVFTKITVQDARQQLARVNLPVPEKKKLQNRLQGNGLLSIKVIPTEYRYLFTAVTLQPSQIPAGCEKILLVDDLLATGSTLLAARDQLLTVIPDAFIDATCLFSAV
jgi:hypothetical protein